MNILKFESKSKAQANNTRAFKDKYKKIMEVTTIFTTNQIEMLVGKK